MENGILHVDMNNFYASVEALYDPSLRKGPVAVAGDKESRHGIILAKNNLAKEKGVKTAEPIWQAMKKCPNLRLVPPHHDRYALYSKLAKKMYCDYTDRVESFGLDECWLDVYDSEKLFGSGWNIAQEIRRRVKEELGLTVSVGVSFNKIFAKLGSDYKKPDAITEFGRKEMETVIWKMPCSELLLVGPSTQRTLLKYGIRTIGELAKADLVFIRRLMGRMGETLWTYANGLDNDPVQRIDAQEEPKTIGNSVTLAHDITTEVQAKKTLFHLAETVSARLRKYGLKAGEVQITVRNHEFQELQRQKRLAAAVCDSRSIYRTALELYLRENKKWAVRLLGIRAGQLSPAEATQVSLFEESDGLKRREQLENAVDRVREKYGPESLTHAFVMSQENANRTGEI